MKIFGYELVNSGFLKAVIDQKCEFESAVRAHQAAETELRYENTRLAKLVNGERACSKSCKYCAYSDEVTDTIYGPFGPVHVKADYRCLLDCLCPEFKRVEERT